MGHDPEYIRRNNIPQLIRQFIPFWDKQGLDELLVELRFRTREIGITRAELTDLFYSTRSFSPHVSQQARLKILEILKKLSIDN